MAEEREMLEFAFEANCTTVNSGLKQQVFALVAFVKVSLSFYFAKPSLFARLWSCLAPPLVVVGLPVGDPLPACNLLQQHHCSGVFRNTDPKYGFAVLDVVQTAFV